MIVHPTYRLLDALCLNALDSLVNWMDECIRPTTREVDSNAPSNRAWKMRRTTVMVTQSQHGTFFLIEVASSGTVGCMLRVVMSFPFNVFHTHPIRALHSVQKQILLLEILWMVGWPWPNTKSHFQLQQRIHIPLFSFHFLHLRMLQIRENEKYAPQTEY